ncbi:MAG TPA: peptide MFS transporter [Conexibacter sp.]|nr:peptide MFS transporter [Conexibacter sp.]
MSALGADAPAPARRGRGAGRHVPPAERTVFGHPRGLATLFMTEMWERFSFYGMRAILVLFLVAPTSDGGLGLSLPEATGVYGIYDALVYVAAMPGGWVADRLLGARRTVMLGGVVISAGHFLMLAPGIGGIVGGLGLVVCGTGLLKPNVSTMVGALYGPEDTRRDAGFSIFYMGINLGAFLAPLAIGPIGQDVSWRLGFGLAGVGMLVGLAQLAYGTRYLGDVGRRAPQPLLAPERARALRRLGLALLALAAIVGIWLGGVVSAVGLERGITLLIVAIPILWFTRAFKLAADEAERDRLRALVALFCASAVFWMVYDQSGSVMSIFAEQDIAPKVAGIEVPASVYQALNPMYILLLAPLMALLWVRLGRRQPSTPVKFAIGLSLVAVGFLLMVGAASAAGAFGKASPLWLVVVYAVLTVGELALSPVGLSAATRLAPAAAAGSTMGVWFLSISVGDAIGGELGALVPVLGMGPWFAVMACFPVVAAVVVLLYRRRIVRWMRGLA